MGNSNNLLSRVFYSVRSYVKVPVAGKRQTLEEWPVVSGGGTKFATDGDSGTLLLGDNHRDVYGVLWGACDGTDAFHVTPMRAIADDVYRLAGRPLRYLGGNRVD